MNTTSTRPGYQSHGVHSEAKDACSDALYELKAQIAGFVSAGVVGPDGFEIASVATRPIEISKLAALSSTLVAVAEAFSLESGEKPCREVILENDGGGRTLLLGMPVQNANYALFVTAGVGVTLGLVLSRTRMCANKIQNLLNANYQADRAE
jgi:predicted regulator of Ras-like GTPase activity (Roadblock/LC7/MglB family)